MTALRFIVEPETLLMTWQPSVDSAHSRMRRTVAEVRVEAEDPQVWQLNYLMGSPDMEAAKAAGFLGHPAFKFAEPVHRIRVRETLLRRLPPRNREDFSDFLVMHRLPDPFPFSDMALLGYTGARLPSDGFAFVPLFPQRARPCEYILEVVGIRHVFVGDLDQIRVGDPVEFVPEPGNEFERDAVAVFWEGQKVGYVNRALLPSIHQWLLEGDVQAYVERKNGSAGRPVLYVRTQLGCVTSTV
jgi:hypothetical protein